MRQRALPNTSTAISPSSRNAAQLAKANLTKRRTAGGGSGGGGGGVGVSSSEHQQQQHQQQPVGTTNSSSSSWEITSDHRMSGGVVRTTGASSPASISNSSHYPQHYNYHHHYHYQNDACKDSSSSLSAVEDANIRIGMKQESILRKRLYGRTKLENYHTVFRKPHHVPDNKYQEFLKGQSSRRRGGDGGDGSGAKRLLPASCTQECCARGCSFFSIIAAIFMFWVGLMIDRQPLYIKGTLPAQMVQSQSSQQAASNNSNNNSKKSKFVIQYLLPIATQPEQEPDRLPTARVAYNAAWAYVFTVLICMYVLHKSWIHAQCYRLLSNRGVYEDIPDHLSTIATASHDSATSGGLGGAGGRNNGLDDFLLLPTQNIPIKHTSPFRKTNNRKLGYDEDDDELVSALSSAPTHAYHYQNNNYGFVTQTATHVRNFLAARGWYKPGPSRYKRKHEPKMV